MAKLAAKTYGDALFEAALEENKLDRIAENVSVLIAVLAQNDELAKLMSHPKISREEKQQVIVSILEGKVEDEVTGFVRLIVEKGRYAELSEILNYFSERVKDYNRIGTAYVTTACELSDGQKAQVEKRLLETTDYEKVEVHYAVDKALIGGMVIRMKDRVVDSSIQTKLYELTKELTKIQLAM